MKSDVDSTASTGICRAPQEVAISMPQADITDKIGVESDSKAN